MKLLVAGSLAALTIAVAAPATPAMAQRVIIGPGGVGVGLGVRPLGVRPYGGYYRGGGPLVRRGPVIEGRSAVRGPNRRGPGLRDY